jgi:signal transduction histidine kinase
MNSYSLAGVHQDMTQRYADSPAMPVDVGLLVDNMSRGVIFLDNRGVLAFINRHALETLKVEKGAVLGKRVDMLPLRTPLYKVLSEPCGDKPMEMVVNGRVITARRTVISSPRGESAGEMTELWDITDERNARRQREEFVSMMTHDLKSPLTVVMGYIQGIRIGMYGEVGGQLRTVIQKLEQSGTKLQQMIDEMLDLYRLEMGMLTINRQPSSLSTILEGCCRDNQRVAQARGILLELGGLEGLPEMAVDAKQLLRVFNNLIGNALKFTAADGVVTITSSYDDGMFSVTVADTGIGIPREDLSRIFTKYYRSAGASGIKGSGLGLAISKAIIEAHGGSIEVESAVGEGSRFRVIVPAPEEDARAT